jgi:hypothetical protein
LLSDVHKLTKVVHYKKNIENCPSKINEWRKNIMNLRMVGFLHLFFLFMIPFHSFAGDFDGSRPLKGSVHKIIEINQFRIRKDISPEKVGIPQRFVIDFKKKVVRPSRDSVIRKICKINSVENVENKLVLQGFEDGVENIDDGLAWSIVISKITGKAVLAASGDGVGYVAFGTCSADDNNQ